MKLKLTRPLIIFDIETTGLDVAKDRIIQISYIKVLPDNTEIRATYTINPQRSIPKDITTLTGISDNDVADKPTFKDIASKLEEEFRGCDLAGFNSIKFDVPILAEEFLRSGIDPEIETRQLIDVQTIYHKLERRNLSAAYKFYCGRNMDEDFTAHRADQDTEATYMVLMAQLDKYNPETEPDIKRQLKNEVNFLSNLSKTSDNVDLAGRLVWKELKDDNGDIVKNDKGEPIKIETFNFGKYKGRSVADVLRSDPGYFGWIQAGDFSQNTKQMLNKIRLREGK